MKSIISLALLVALLLPAIPALAAEEIAETPAVTQVTAPAAPSEPEPSSVTSSKSVAGLQAMGKTQIKARVSALTRLMNKVAKSDISLEQRATLKAELQTGVDGLNALLVKISAEQNLDTLKGLVKSIYTDFRIFAIAIPRVEGELAVYRQMMAGKKLSDHAMKLEAKLNEWAAKDVDVSVSRTNLAVAKKSADTAAELYKAALAGFQSLKPADYPAKATIEKARKDLKEGNKNILAARNALKKVVTLMRNVDRKVKMEERKAKVMEKNAKKAEKKIEKRVEKAEERAEKRAEKTAEVAASVVTLTNSGFTPAALKVKVGTKVIFKNQASGGMWIASNNHPVHSLLPGFDQKGSGGEYSFTFTQVGSWGFHNHLSPSTTGTIVVE